MSLITLSAACKERILMRGNTGALLSGLFVARPRSSSTTAVKISEPLSTFTDTSRCNERKKKRPAVNPWAPMPGMDAAYIGTTGRLLKAGRRVRILAEAAGGRMLVQAIGHNSEPVKFTVYARNLGRPQPDLFD